MRILLAVLLLLLPGATGAPVPEGEPGDTPVPVFAVACDDALDVLLLLDVPGAEAQVVEVVDQGPLAMATVSYTATTPQGAVTWVVLYTFPSTIFAHSIVSVPFKADELE